MSASDRTADRVSCLCEAYGCPLLGTRSTSTSGGGFMCHIHFGLDQGLLQVATGEINRLSWLALAIRDLRSMAHNPNWLHTKQRIWHDMKLAQRSDLAKRPDEDWGPWATRLENELSAIVKLVIVPQQQQDLAA